MEDKELNLSKYNESGDKVNIKELLEELKWMTENLNDSFVNMTISKNS